MAHSPCYTHLKALKKAPIRLIALRNNSTTTRQLVELRDHVSARIRPPMLPLTNILQINISETVLAEPVFNAHDVVHLSVLKHYITLLSQFIQNDYTFLNSTIVTGNKRWNEKVKMWAEWTTIEHWFGFKGPVRIPDSGWHDRVLVQLWTLVYKRAKQLKKEGQSVDTKGKSLTNGLKKLWKLRYKVAIKSSAKVEISGAWRNEKSSLEWPGVG